METEEMEPELVTRFSSHVLSHPPLSENKFVDILRKLFSLRACTLYAVSDTSAQLLVLAACAGIDMKSFRRFELSSSSMAGKSLDLGKPLVVEIPPDGGEFEHNVDFAAEKLNYLIAIPIPIPSQCDASTLGPNQFCNVLCLYPENYCRVEDVNRDFPTPVLTSIQSTTSIWQGALLDATRSSLMTSIQDECAAGRDFNSFSHRIIRVLKKTISVEAASIFIVDPYTNDQINLSSTTSLTNTNHTKRSVFIDSKSSQNSVSKAFLDGTPESSFEWIGDGDVFPEETVNPFRSLCAIPIRVGSHSLNKKPVGVIRVVNREFFHGESAGHVGFREIYLAGPASMFLALAYLAFSKVRHISEDFALTIHGFDNNLRFMEASISQLQQYGASVSNPALTYVLPDCLSAIQALSWQMRKFSDRDKPAKAEFGRVLLVGDVISKCVPTLKYFSKYYGVEPDGGKVYDESMRIPAVWSDSSLLMTVLRNLLENAAKYCDDETYICKVRLNWRERESSIVLVVSDWGLGIPAEDSERVFEQGFRSDAAKRRVTSGVSAGLGLYQCREIMHQLNGNIRLTSNENPTTFELEIPKSFD